MSLQGLPGRLLAQGEGAQGPEEEDAGVELEGRREPPGVHERGPQGHAERAHRAACGHRGAHGSGAHVCREALAGESHHGAPEHLVGPVVAHHGGEEARGGGRGGHARGGPRGYEEGGHEERAAARAVDGRGAQHAEGELCGELGEGHGPLEGLPPRVVQEAHEPKVVAERREGETGPDRAHGRHAAPVLGASQEG
eukprot:CAMPEP_0206018676 /NCGR_PEP_ID=MMETSP1464-20131121/27599_1 /ASSEMBLY_ACC=CAM_ASM_001124 /TAXON_ID=119497 /ORGANISM="Exanthemachrysis gayraliae, Strain RCC1523" /LENGTH=195 /DNA_ID=CAMNT_0053392563 /DNA_START=29 /DNA_END=616 /DNA_ORIENTATION=-